MLFRFISIILIIVISGCMQPKNLVAPDWFSTMPSHRDTSYATGVDNNEIYAIGNALFQLGINNFSSITSFRQKASSDKIEHFETLSEAIVSFNIGSINIEGISKSISKEKDNISTVNNYTNIYEILSENFVIQAAFEEKDDKVVVDDKSIYGVNKVQLINELEKSGVRVTLESNSNQYYCLIAYPKNN